MAAGLRTVALALALPVAVSAQRPAGGSSEPATGDTAVVAVARPTVIAYLVIPRGAVDTSADLAVLADDWNVAMATLGDSLEARGIRFALVTERRLRVRAGKERAVVLALDREPRAGYVYVRPGMPPCLRRGAAEMDDVLRIARVLFARVPPSAATRRATCGTNGP